MLKASFSLPKNEIKATFKIPKNEIKSTFSIKKVVPLEDLDFATNERVENIVNDFTNDLEIIATELDNRYTKLESDSLLNNKQPLGDYAVKSDIDLIEDSIDTISAEIIDLIKNKAEKSDTYTKGEVDAKISTIKVDAYTKNESDDKFGSKEDVNLNKNQIEVILDTIEDDKKIINKNFDSIAGEIEKTNNNLDALTGDVENLSGEIENKQDKINDLDIIRAGAIKGATALQEIPEEYAKKSDIPDVNNFATNTRVNEVEGKIPSISGLAKDSDVVHKANAETITGIKTFNGGKVSSGAQPSIIATNGFTAGGYNVTGWADISCHRLCNNQINTGSYYMNSDGSVIFRHKTGTALAEGSANDAVLMLHPVTGITAGWSGKAGTATTTGNVLVTDFNVQKGIATSVANSDGGEITLSKAFANANYTVNVTPRAIGNYFVSTQITATNKFKVRISDYYGNPVAVSFSWLAIEN